MSARINDVDISTPDKLIPEDFKKAGLIEKKKNKFKDLFKSKDQKRKERGAFGDASKSMIPGHVDHIYA